MKKSIFSVMIFGALILSSCGGGGANPGEEVCECYKKANEMKADDPKRSEEQTRCVKLQGEKWNEIKDDAEKAAEFNKTIGECSKEMKNSALTAE